MATSSTVHPDRVYDIVSERKLDDDRLPTPEELREAVSALGAVEEFLTDQISKGVIDVARRCAEEGESPSVTFEDVARLIGWADSVRHYAEEILGDAEKVLVVARDSLMDAAGGYLSDGLPFDGNRVLVDDPSWKFLLSRLGFRRDDA